MTPRDHNVIKTLNLLVLLWRARKQHIPKLEEPDQHKIVVTKANLRDAELTLPVLANTLTTLDKKGYLTATFFLTEEAYEKMHSALDQLEQAREELRKNPNPEFSRQLQKFAVDFYEKRMAHGFRFDKKGFEQGDITPDVLIDTLQSLLKDIPKDTAAIVVLLPFRSTERLLEKMNDGMKFEEVQDAGIWYDAKTYQLHFQDKVFSAAYRGTASNMHYVLNYLFNVGTDLVADYSDIRWLDKSSDPAISNKALADTLRNFVKKKPEIRDLFRIYSDRVELNSEYKDDIH